MNCISLIGMPGAGKSTLGVQLAKEAAKDFVDTDVLIQVREGKTLQQLMDDSDYLALRQVEEDVLLSLDLENHVIATGGSVIYSDEGMAQLKALGSIVFLDVTLDELRNRIDNYESRGIARRPNQSFAELYDERRALYFKYADFVIDCNGRSQGQFLQKLHHLVEPLATVGHQ